MNKPDIIFCHIDRHFGYVIDASRDLSLIQEFVMDDFFELYQAEMQKYADEHFINVEEPSEQCRTLARQTWRSMMNYWNEAVTIQPIEIV